MPEVTPLGMTDYSAAMADEEILRRLLALNLERAAAAASVAGSQPAA